MYPLTDISIYNLFDPIQIPETEQSVFPYELSFISELYHENMNGYKPKKTSRICIDIATEQGSFEPCYFGSICHCFHYFDSRKYFMLDKTNKYDYITNYIHETVTGIAKKLDWDKPVFDEAYKKTKNSNYKNVKLFSSKLSPDKRKTGQAILEKMEGRIILSFHINKSIDETKILIDKQNFYPSDFTNIIAKKAKWIDNDKFGYKDTKSDKTIYYNIQTKKRFRNFKMMEEENPFPD